jgi:hypothetical protein
MISEHSPKLRRLLASVADAPEKHQGEPTAQILLTFMIALVDPRPALPKSEPRAVAKRTTTSAAAATFGILRDTGAASPRVPMPSGTRATWPSLLCRLVLGT